MPGRGRQAALLAVVAAVVVAGVQITGEQAPWSQRLAGSALLLAATAALWWRDRAPVAVLAATAGAAVTYYLVGGPPGPEPVPFVVALYAAARAGHRRIAIASVPMATLVVFLADRIAAQATGRPTEGGDLVTVAAVLVAAVGLGELARARDGQRQAVREQAAAEERLRIARELHDSLAHQLTAISVQASAALRRRERRPELAYPTLETIRRVAGEALADVRDVLGVLRATPQPTRPEDGPALAALRSLAEDTGLTVTVAIAGDPAPIPSTVERTVYRIVQEALTNVARHAGTTEAEIRLTYGQDDLVVEVHDRGAGGSTAPGGYGLVGMRERVTALGGDLRAGVRPEGGFAVQACLPLAPPHSGSAA